MPSASSRSVTARVRVVVAERDADLREHHVVEDLGAVDRARCPSAMARRVRGQAVDQIGDPGAAERAQRRPHRDAAGAPRQLGHLLQRVARPAVVVDEVARRACPNARAQRGGSRDDRDAAVVRDVEGLVRVGRPRVGASRSRRAGAAASASAAAQSPNAPSTCTQAPCSCATSMASPIGSNAPECRLPACRHDDRRPARLAPARSASASATDPALVVGGDGRRRAEPEVAQREVDGVVPLRADEHPHPRARRSARRGRRPSRRRRAPAAAPAARPVKLAMVRAGDEPDVGVGRQAEQVEQPRRPRPPRPPRRRASRSRMPVFWSHALISQSAASAAGRCRRSPSRRTGPTASPSAPARPCGEQVDDLGGVGRPVGQRAAEPGTELVCGRRGGTGRVGTEPSQARACAAARSRAAA